MWTSFNDNNRYVYRAVTIAGGSSGTAASPVNQAADRMLTLIAAPTL